MIVDELAQDDRGPGSSDDIKNVWVISRPIIEGDLEVLGDKQIAIPTAFYKILVRRNSYWESSARAIALYYPQEREDYELKKNSPCVDAGGFLTHSVGEGAGRAIKVGDPYFFSDGFGVVEGDIICVGAKEVQVTTVDYRNKQLILSKPIQWSDKAPISLTYKGSAPDIGAIESY